MRNTVERLLDGRTVRLHDGNSVTFIAVVDFIPSDRSVGIPNSYAVCVDEDATEYVVFEDGEIQCNDAIVGHDQEFGDAMDIHQHGHLLDCGGEG